MQVAQGIENQRESKGKGRTAARTGCECESSGGKICRRGELRVITTGEAWIWRRQKHRRSEDVQLRHEGLAEHELAEPCGPGVE